MPQERSNRTNFSKKSLVDLEPYTITFSNKEADALLDSHHDALVILLYIANCLIKRILDATSSTKILKMIFLKEMRMAKLT